MLIIAVTKARRWPLTSRYISTHY